MSKKRMSPRRAPARNREKQLRIRGQLRQEPDVGRIARTVIAIAMAQAEKDAQSERARTTGPRGRHD